LKPNVLFLCTGNSARSQMGEAFLRKYAGDRFEVFSAGLEPKGINPYTVRVMDEVGVDIRGHTSDSLRKYMGHKHFTYVITVCGHADENCPHGLWSRGEKLHWPFEDPAAVEGNDQQKLAKFRKVRDEIEAKVKRWVEELKAAQ
jgi:arsenate reductase (thioredoxin)